MMYIIAKDGSGDFTSLQAAIDAIPGGGRAPTILLLRMDEYRERVVVNKDNVRIVGEARDRTVLTYSACAKDPDENGEERGTFLSFTLLVTGNNVEVENLTIRNDAGDGRQVGQAVAVYAAGDRGVWRNCRFIAHQDTLFCGPMMPLVEDFIAPRVSRADSVPQVNEPAFTRGRQYFENCFIRGDVDFIFGSYRCWFERCELFMNARGGFYTAANTPEGQPYGFVFHRCRLTGECEDGAAYLGRPWRKFARTLFLRCEMDAHVAPLGFIDWDAERVVTGLLGEWRTEGARAEQSARHPAQRRLSDEEAALVTLPEVLGGADGWQPDVRTPTWFLCGDSTMADYAENCAPMAGWGQALRALVPSGVFVENCAVCGRSSKSFVAEKRLNFIELCLRPGDRLIVSFSHNDEKRDPLRYTSARITFPEYLNMYIDAALRQGAEPVLVTPIARRLFSAEGRLLATHMDYPAAMRDLALNRGVRLVELERATMALVQSAGVEGSRALYCHVEKGHPNYPDGCEDNSHLHLTGAVRIARLFLRLLRGEAVEQAEAGSGDFSGELMLEDRVVII